ncbi:gamma-glutamyltransferase [Kwoniella dendrophila CBS 6074]|uniref:Glutathione hydrolase n=1 Tax=Kwoniella dendrophila CBS 6074 TaxID=1295534 RepID=A0AAX4JN38_9TREE
MVTNNDKILSGAVTSEDTRASKIGTDILAAGGNAVDSIIATILAVNTLCPYHSDIGGGGFAILRDEKGEYKSLNFRHTAPAAATSDFYVNPDVSSSIGGTSVAVPGEIKGLEELHLKYGKLPWEILFEPSIKLSENGFEVSQDLNDFITPGRNPYGTTDFSWMHQDLCYSTLFTNEGQPIPVGSIWKRPEYAQTLKKIAKEGSKAFYEGEIAQAIVDSVREKGGLMTTDDLQNYTVEWNQPLSIQYKDYTIYSIPAPGSGAIFLSAMGILSHLKTEGPGSVEDLHNLTETLRLAYGQRTSLGDPNYVPGLIKKQLDWLKPESIKERSKLITETTHEPDYYKPPGIEIVNDNGTSNITVADSNGMIISITTTVGLGWGSHIMVPKYGFILNDSMDDFSIKGRSNYTGYAPQPTNYIQGGKRPLSSSCPYIISNSLTNKPFLAGGSSGGSTIISANIQIVRNILEYKLSPKESLKENRIHNQILPNYTSFEKQFHSQIQNTTVKGFDNPKDESIIVELEEKRGHKVNWINRNISVPVIIKFNNDDFSDTSNSNLNLDEGIDSSKPEWEVAADPRRHNTGGSIFIAPTSQFHKDKLKKEICKGCETCKNAKNDW